MRARAISSAGGAGPGISRPPEGRRAALSLIDRLKNLRDQYVARQTERLRMPEFRPSPKARRRVWFSGRVQGVGFRIEMCLIADRLELTGWVQNLPDGRVTAEVQGEEAKIAFLLDYMGSIRRISIEAMKTEDLPVDPAEAKFMIKEDDPYV